MNLSLAILVVYVLVLLLSMLVTFVTFIIFLLEKKPRESQACGNILIASATVCAVVGYLSVPLIEYVRSRDEIPTIPASATVQSNASKAELAASAITKAEAGLVFVRRYPQLAQVPVLMGLHDVGKAQGAVEKFFKDLPEKQQQTFDIATRQAIFNHAIGKPMAPALQKLMTNSSQENVEKALDKYLKSEDDEVLREHMRESLRRKMMSSESIDKDEAAYVSLIQNIDNPIAKDKLADSVAIVEKRLPDGWYRYALLKSLYKAAGADNELRAQVTAHDEYLLARMHRMLAGCIMIVLWLCGGIAGGIALFLTLRKPVTPTPLENQLGDSSIKLIYSQSLAIYYVQFVVSFFVGLVGALVFGQAKNLNQFTSLSTILIFTGNLIMLAITTQVMLCKPQGLNIREVLPRLFPIRLRQALAWSLGGFCLARTLVFLFTITLMLAFRHQTASSNPFDHMIVTAAINSNPLDIALIWLGTAVLAPLYEEIMFRGIFYAALRKRLGVTKAVLLSAAIFAASHMDINLFVGHFIVGVTLATIYERTRSLFPCFLTHMFWNSSVMLMAWLMV